MFVNQKEFDALDKATQDAVLEAGKARRGARLEAHARLHHGVARDAAHQQDDGVRAPTPAFKADLTKMGETMLNEWLAKAGPDGQAIIGAFRK